MAQKCKTIYKSSRERAGLTQESATELLHVDISTLSKYERGLIRPSDDTVADMMDAYSDEYLGYLHLLDSKVGQRILPRGVERCTMLEAVVKTSLAIDEYTEEIKPMMKASVDGKITDDEVKPWLDSKGKLEAVAKSYYSLEFADGEL